MSVSSSGGVLPTPSPVHGQPSQILLPRDGDRDLIFRGRRLSQVKDCQDIHYGPMTTKVERCTEVAIYLTEGKTIVTQVRRWDVQNGAVKHEEHAVATHSPNDRNREGFPLGFSGAVEQAIKWLKKDNGGKLGALSKKAWAEACEMSPALLDEVAERID